MAGVRRRVGIGALAVWGALVAGMAGCGGSGGDEVAITPSEAPGPTLAARLLVGEEVSRTDPLYASNAAERLVSRQIYEPLTAVIQPPFGETDARRGPARPAGAEGNDELWEFQLRTGVSFHDGEALNADAVLANVTRWQESGAAARLLPELVGAFSPAPGKIRFQLSAPVPRFPARLDRVPLGLVSPAAIEQRGAAPIRPGRFGTGPFEVREIDARGVLLAGSADWWGGELGLGPGVERLELATLPGPALRLSRLRAGLAQVAWGLTEGQLAEIRSEPLLTAFAAPGGRFIGAERSVRGLDGSRSTPLLSSLWLTSLR